jgi:tRNA(Ile)-lysidine synthase
MFDRVISYIEYYHLLPENGTVVVAVSGGADSLCLLHLLQRICGPGKRYAQVDLHVAHLDHGLRPEISAHEADIVAQIARSWNLGITVGRVDVPALARQEHRSLEDAARLARYRFLREVACGQPIAVAHHQDDQVETLILHWLRGGGISSMIGLQPHQQDIIRPLLAVSRSDILAYCDRHGLKPLEDTSNADVRFLRNRIRHELLPMLEAINPNIRATLIRSAETIRVDAAWIESQVDACWTDILLEEDRQYVRLSLTRLLALPLSLQRHVLRRASARLHDGQSPLEARHYALLDELLHRQTGRRSITLDMPRFLSVVREQDTLLLQKTDSQVLAASSTKENIEVTLPIPGRVALPGTPWLAEAEIIERPDVYAALHTEDWSTVWCLLARDRYTIYVDGNRIGKRVLVRTRRAGDRMRPLGMAHEKKIQDVLVDRHIPRAERDHIPLFFSTQHCIWLAGVQIDDRVRLTPATRQIVRFTLRAQEETGKSEQIV